MTVKVKDNGFKKRLANLAKPAVVSVGVHAADGAKPEGDSGMTVADIAGIHEFGLGVPERSWLRDFVDENRPKLLSMLRDVGKEIAAGEDPDKAMNRFGLVVVGMVKERIIAGIDPPLAEVTKLRKQQITGGAAKDTPLILFGQFISSIAHEVQHTK